MERIWAPWRGEYIVKPAGEKSAGGTCLFCDLLVEDERDDRQNLLLYRGRRVMVVLNKYPYNNGHLLVLPRQHIGDFDGLDDETFDDLHRTVVRCKKALEGAMSPHGINIGMNVGAVAGAGIPDHMHYHLVPRWHGDTNFMPVIGETKVISQHVLSTHDRLKPYFREPVPTGLQSRSQ